MKVKQTTVIEYTKLDNIKSQYRKGEWGNGYVTYDVYFLKLGKSYFAFLCGSQSGANNSMFRIRKSSWNSIKHELQHKPLDQHPYDVLDRIGAEVGIGDNFSIC